LCLKQGCKVRLDILDALQPIQCTKNVVSIALDDAGKRRGGGEFFSRFLQLTSEENLASNICLVC